MTAPSTPIARRGRAPAPLHRTTVARPVNWWQELVGEVEWSVPFVAFLYYMFVIITYWLPGADIAMVIALVTLALRPAEWRIAPGLVLFGAFLAWCFVSWVNSSYQAEAWEQTYTLFKVWLVSVVAFNVIRTRAQLRFFLIFIVACFSLFPMRGAFFNYFGGYSVWGRALWNFSYANPNDLAAFAILYASMAFALFFLCKSTLVRLGAIGSGTLMMILIFFTQSRGALLSVAVVAAIAILAKRRDARVLLGAAGVLVLGAFFAPDGTWKRLGGIFTASASEGFKGADEEGSAEQRWQLLQVSVVVAKENALFGVGPGVYSIVHGQYAQRLAGTLPMASGNRDPHNTAMRTAAETGYIGLVLFAAMVGATLYRARKAIKRSTDPRAADFLRFLFYGMTAFMLAGLFGSFTYLNMLYISLAVFECAFSLSPRPAAAPRRHGRHSRGRGLRPASQPGS